jgi:hypothetical protein
MTVIATVTPACDIPIRRQKRSLNEDSMSDVYSKAQIKVSSTVKDGTYMAKPRTMMFIDDLTVKTAIRHRWKPVEQQIVG